MNNNIQKKENKWLKYFKKEDPKTKVWKTCRNVSIALFIAVVIIKESINEGIIEFSLYKEMGTGILEISFNILLTITITAVLNLAVDFYDEHFVEKIRTLTYGDHDFLPEFLQSFESFKDKYRKEQEADIYFDEYPPDDNKYQHFYKVNIEMEYKISFKEYTELKFIFMREFKDESRTNYYSGKNEQIVDCQWFWAWQESQEYISVLENNDYKILSVYVNDEDVFDNFENVFIDNVKYEKDNSKPTKIEYRCVISTLLEKYNWDKNEMHKVRFVAQIPLLKNETFTLIADVPTFKNCFKVNYSKLIDKMDCYVYSFTGPNDKIVKLNTSQNGVLEYEYDSCLLPKYGYVVSFWSKKQDDNTTLPQKKK